MVLEEDVFTSVKVGLITNATRDTNFSDNRSQHVKKIRFDEFYDTEENAG